MQGRRRGSGNQSDRATLGFLSIKDGPAMGYEAPCINYSMNIHRLIRLSVDNTAKNEGFQGLPCSCVGLQRAWTQT
jgi:hypothetical protein